MSGSVSTRTANRQAERVTASGQLRLPAMLGRAAGEVEQQLARRRRPRAGAARGRPPAPRARPWRGRVASGELGQAGTRAPLGVVEHRVGGLAQALGAEAVRELGQAQRAGAVGGELGAQVRAPLGRLAHARDELVDRVLVQRPRARSRRPPPRACGCRRASIRARARPRRRGARGSRRSRGGSTRRRAKTGVTTVMSGRCVPPANGSLRIQDTPGACCSLEHGGDGGGHRAEVHGDVLGLHDHLRRRGRTARSRRRGAP